MNSFQKEFPQFSSFFPFPEFNPVQLKCYKSLTKDNRNMIVSSPTSSGKTVIFELAIIKSISTGPLKCLYLAPIKSLCHEKSTSWIEKFQNKINVFELTSDTSQEDENTTDLNEMNLVIATPEKIDSFTRKSLAFLSEINLLLVDEIHMLNYEERGATLEAVISRIMSLNNPRIIAVSATIPNIKEVAQWLKVTHDMTFTFGEEYRPVKIHKVVLGFKSSNNPYTFEKLLNYKLIEVIRSYSEGKGALVFCQTQKGTEMACQQIISDMKEREFIDSDQTLMALIQGSKRVANSSLQIMLPQGVAFHNAGLSLSDRSIIEKLFLQNRIRILCTTSTLAMGINLPARLVVIKSTQSYKGSTKGYQEYTQIEIDQMTGRAGRPPFDTEGTVVIMTEKQNYNKYLNSGKLETLESHLYGQLTEHLNAEIALKSLQNFEDVLRYFMNSFCYIRMKNSPNSYQIKGDLQTNTQKICLESINKLNTYNLIRYYPENKNIVARQLGINVARNSIEIETIGNIIKGIENIKTERDYLALLCDAEEVKKYRNKLDERKILKELNEKNKYTIKNTIGTAEKKFYVLIQCELDGRNIENWELRKQAKEIMYFMRRLTHCVKTASQELQLFWAFYWSCMINKYCTLKFWNRNEQMGIRQFSELNEKWKMLSAKGFKNLDHLIGNLGMVDTICQKNSEFSKGIARKVSCLKEGIEITLSKCNERENIFEGSHENFESESYEESTTIPYNKKSLKIQRSMKVNNNAKDTLMTIVFSGNFDSVLKEILIIVGEQDSLYTIRSLKENNKTTNVALNSSKKYNVAIIKSGYIGFDEFYQIQGREVKLIPDVTQLIDFESDDKINKVNKDKDKDKERHKSNEHETESRKSLQINNKSMVASRKSEKSKTSEKFFNSNDEMIENTEIPDQTIPRKKIPITRTNNKNNNKRSTIRYSRKKIVESLDNEEEYTRMNVRPGSYIPLEEYKCWKYGKDAFGSDSEESKSKVENGKLLIVDEASSKSRSELSAQIQEGGNSKKSICWTRYAYKEPKEDKEEKSRVIYNTIRKDELEKSATNPYDYFMQLFDN